MWIIIIACLGITGCAVKEDKADTKEISYVEESYVETKEEEALEEDDTWETFLSHIIVERQSTMKKGNNFIIP